MTRIMLIALVVATLFILILYRRKKTPQQRLKFIYKVILACLLGLISYLTLTGKMHFLFALGAAVIPFLSRLLPLIKYVPILKKLYQKKQSTKQSTNTKHSTVETFLLRMNLNHETGHMDGDVLSGPYIDKKLSNLSPTQLLDLYRQAKAAHPDSLSILEAYLDQAVGEHWHDDFIASSQEGSRKPNSHAMSTLEALDILGLEDGASHDDIINAHRKLIQKLHPDRGGSHYLATKLNQAKAHLLHKR